MISNHTRWYAEHDQQPPAKPGYKWLPKWTTNLERGHYVENWIPVKVDKAPRLNFKPGTYVNFKTDFGVQLYEIKYCYRTAANPHEWLFCMYERKNLSIPKQTQVQAAISGLGVGDGIKTVVSEIFLDSSDANQYFADIYRDADLRIATNKEMLNKATVVSSGALVNA